MLASNIQVWPEDSTTLWLHKSLYLSECTTFFVERVLQECPLQHTTALAIFEVAIIWVQAEPEGFAFAQAVACFPELIPGKYPAALARSSVEHKLCHVQRDPDIYAWTL